MGSVPVACDFAIWNCDVAVRGCESMSVSLSNAGKLATGETTRCEARDRSRGKHRRTSARTGGGAEGGLSTYHPSPDQLFRSVSVQQQQQCASTYRDQRHSAS